MIYIKRTVLWTLNDGLSLARRTTNGKKKARWQGQTCRPPKVSLTSLGPDTCACRGHWVTSLCPLYETVIALSRVRVIHLSVVTAGPRGWTLSSVTSFWRASKRLRECIFYP